MLTPYVDHLGMLLQRSCYSYLMEWSVTTGASVWLPILCCQECHHSSVMTTLNYLRELRNVNMILIMKYGMLYQIKRRTLFQRSWSKIHCRECNLIKWEHIHGWIFISIKVMVYIMLKINYKNTLLLVLRLVKYQTMI